MRHDQGITTTPKTFVEQKDHLEYGKDQCDLVNFSMLLG